MRLFRHQPALTPITADGRRLRPLGPGWVALVDRDGWLLTERGPGYVWISFPSVHEANMMLNPDLTDRTGRLVLPVIVSGTGFLAFGLDDEGEICRQDGMRHQVFSVRKGDTVSVTSTWITDDMA